MVALLASAPDAAFDDLPAVALSVLAAISGAVRSAFGRGATPRVWRTTRAHLALMGGAYLREAANPLFLARRARQTVALTAWLGPGRRRCVADAAFST